MGYSGRSGRKARQRRRLYLLWVRCDSQSSGASQYQEQLLHRISIRQLLHAPRPGRPCSTRRVGCWRPTPNSACNGHTSIVTDTWFSYSPRGEATDIWESYLYSGGWFHTQQNYFPNGEIASLEGFQGTGTTTPFSELFTYGLDGEGRRYSVTGSQSSTILSSTTYNAASQPTGVNLLDGGESISYDPNTGRMTQWRSTAGSLAQTGTFTWNANATLKQLALTDNYNPSNVQTCMYGYDDLARLTNVGCGAPWTQAFSYEAIRN